MDWLPLTAKWDWAVRHMKECEMGVCDERHCRHSAGLQAVILSGLGDSAAADISQVVVRSGKGSPAAVERD